MSIRNHDKIESELFDYLEGSLCKEDEAAIREHLNECAECRSRLETAKRGGQVFSAFMLKNNINLVPDVMKKISSAPSVGPAAFPLKPAVIFCFLALMLCTAVLFFRPGNNSEIGQADKSIESEDPPRKEATLPPMLAENKNPVAASEPKSEYSSASALRISVSEPGPRKGLVISDGMISAETVDAICTIEGTGEFLLLHPGRMTCTENHIFLESGTLWCNVSKRNAYAKPFEVKTENALISIVGTAFEVTAKNSQTCVKLYSGKLHISNSDSLISLNSGYSLEISHRNAAVSMIDFSANLSTRSESTLCSILQRLANERVSTKHDQNPQDVRDRLTTDDSMKHMATEPPASKPSPLELLNRLSIEPDNQKD